MSTISETIAKDIIAGKYEEDNQIKIVRYMNQWGTESFGVVFAHQNPDRYENSPACSYVEILWTKDRGVTSEGAFYLKI